MSGAQLDRERLAKVLGLLGSDHPGEVAEAARQAERLRRAARLTWHDIILPGLPPPGGGSATAELWEVIRFCSEHPATLTGWEINFLATLMRRRSPLSDKQLAVLQRLVTKCRTAERAAS